MDNSNSSTTDADKAILEKYQASNSMSLDALKDPGVFQQIAQEHFDRIDRDGSGSLNRIELYDSQMHASSDAEREVSRVLLQNYDKAINLASPNQPPEIAGVNHSGGGRMAWNNWFHDGNKSTNEITEKDLQVIYTLQDPKMLALVLDDVRTEEIETAGMELIGTLFVAAGVASTIEAPPVAIGIGALGVAAVAGAANNIFHTSKPAFDREVEKRYANLHSWNYFNENDSHKLIERELNADEKRH